MHKPYNIMHYALGQSEWGKYDIIRKYVTGMGCLKRCTWHDSRKDLQSSCDHSMRKKDGSCHRQCQQFSSFRCQVLLPPASYSF